jgi:hypothetical protein
MGNIRPRYNAAPSQELLVIRKNHCRGYRKVGIVDDYYRDDDLFDSASRVGV